MKNRIESIDTLRGFIVLLLFMANTPIWAGYKVVSDTDFYATFTRSWLTDGWLYLTFSLLFGASLILFNPTGSQWLKRMAILFGIGVFHGLFLNYADILAHYAILGLIAYRFRELGSFGLILRGFIFVSIPIILLSILTLLIRDTNFISVVMGDSYWLKFQLSQLIFNSWGIFGMMLIGMGLAKSNYFSNPKFGLVESICFLLAMILAAFVYAVSKYLVNDASTIILFFGIYPFWALAITNIFVLCIRSPLLATLGRMSLSLYIFQSILGLVLFRIPESNATASAQLLIGLGTIILFLIIAEIFPNSRPIEKFYRWASH